MYRLIALLVLVCASAHAQVTSLTTYVTNQIPDNTSRQVKPVNVRNAILAFPGNIYVSSTFPVTTTSYVSASAYYGDGSHLTGVVGGSSTTPGGISSSVQFNNGSGNSLGGDSFFTYISSLLQVPSISATNISVTGPVFATTYFGDGSHLTGISAGSSNYNSLTNIPVVLANISNSTGSVSVSTLNANTFTGGSFTGNGSGLTNVSASSVDYANVQNKPAGVINIGNSTGSITATTGSFTTMGIGSLTASGTVSAATLDSFNLSSTNIAGLVGNFTGVNAGTFSASNLVSSPLVYVGTLSATTTSGTYGYFRYVSATQLAGDCSLCTNIPSGGTPQSLVSGTTRVDARTDGSISFTTGGIVVAYIDPVGRYVTTNISSTNISLTNVQLSSSTLLAGQQLYARSSPGGLIVDGSAGAQYDFNTDNSMFSSTDLPAGVTPSATVHISGTLLVTAQATLGNVSVTRISGDGSQLTGIVAGTTISTTQNQAGNISGSFGIGPFALVGTGVSNTSVGASALRSAGAATENTAIGANALRSNVSGVQNTAIGSNALFANLNQGNTAVGSEALQAETGAFNTGVGGLALDSSTGTQNSALGDAVFLNLGTGDNNTGLGYQAGRNLTSGNGNVAIGSIALFPAAGVSNNLVIQNSIYGTNMGLSTVGIGIGYQSPTVALAVSGTISSTAATFTSLTVGSCSGCGGGGSSISTTTFTAASNISGSTSVGFLASVGTGTSNTSYGAAAASSTTTGLRNTAIGARTLKTNVTNSDFTAVGYNALSVANNAGQSSAFGSGALALFAPSISSRFNDAFGFNALSSLGDASNNAAFGNTALGSLTTGNLNTAFGYNVGLGVSGASSGNTYIGDEIDGGSGGVQNNNTAVGHTALFKISTGANNTVMGDSVAVDLTTGMKNTILGQGAGAVITTGGSNIIIGAGVNAISATVSNSLNIANAITGNIGSSTGLANFIGINVTSPTSAFEVSGTVAFDNIASSAGIDYLCYNSSTGNVTFNTTTCTVSDERLKTNIMPYNGGLAKVMNMHVHTFDFKNPMYGKGQQVGFIAQELEPILPQMIGHSSDGTLSVDYAKMSAITIAAIQEQEAHIDAQQKDINQLRLQVQYLMSHQGKSN